MHYISIFVYIFTQPQVYVKLAMKISIPLQFSIISADFFRLLETVQQCLRPV